MSHPHIGYAAMLERFAPGEVIALAQRAELAGLADRHAVVVDVAELAGE